jgi:hypothetical protein
MRSFLSMLLYILGELFFFFVFLSIILFLVGSGYYIGRCFSNPVSAYQHQSATPDAPDSPEPQRLRLQENRDRSRPDLST